MTNNEIESKAKELQREYARKWRKKNKEKVARTNKRYWERLAAKVLESEKEGVNGK